MARPKGYRLDRSALDALLIEMQISMTEAAESCGMPLTSLSSIANGDSGASIKTVRALVNGLGCEAGDLFPELAKAEVQS